MIVLLTPPILTVLCPSSTLETHKVGVPLEREDLILTFDTVKAPPGKSGVSKQLLTDPHPSFYSGFSSIAVDTDGWKGMGKTNQGTDNQEIVRTIACSTAPTRSEEHTSELQSHSDLVCRLLLEKKNENSYVITYKPGTQSHSQLTA